MNDLRMDVDRYMARRLEISFYTESVGAQAIVRIRHWGVQQLYLILLFGQMSDR